MKNFVDTILTELKQARGIDFSGYHRNMIERRFYDRMANLSKKIVEKLIGSLSTGKLIHKLMGFEKYENSK